MRPSERITLTARLPVAYDSESSCQCFVESVSLWKR